MFISLGELGVGIWVDRYTNNQTVGSWWAILLPLISGLCVGVSVYQSLDCLPMSVCICMSCWLFICISVYLSIYLFILLINPSHMTTPLYSISLVFLFLHLPRYSASYFTHCSLSSICVSFIRFLGFFSSQYLCSSTYCYCIVVIHRYRYFWDDF